VVTLSVVVPATDAPPTLARCLAALAASDDPPDQVVVVEEPAELSAAAARNAGARRASGDVLVFVDADVEVHHDALARVRASFDESPSLVAAYGSYDDSPGVPTTVSTFRNLLHHQVHHAGAGSAETFWSGLGAVRLRAFLDVGGFDEQRYPHPSIEDIELGRRLRASGAHIVLDPAIQGKHLKAWTLRSMLWTDFARRGVPWVALQVRERRVSSTLNLGWRHRCCAVACVLAVLGALLVHPLWLFAAIVTLCALNAAFYVLLVRRQGLFRGVAGIGLHAMHYLVAVVAVPVGIVHAMSGHVGSVRTRRRIPTPAVDTSLAE
jgi:GT2 family glycosyltransferase